MKISTFSKAKSTKSQSQSRWSRASTELFWATVKSQKPGPFSKVKKIGASSVTCSQQPNLTVRNISSTVTVVNKLTDHSEWSAICRIGSTNSTNSRSVFQLKKHY